MDAFFSIINMLFFGQLLPLINAPRTVNKVNRVKSLLYAISNEFGIITHVASLCECIWNELVLWTNLFLNNCMVNNCGYNWLYLMVYHGGR